MEHELRPPHPVILALDTAHQFCQGAIVRADGELHQIVEPRSRGHAERLISMVDELLALATLSIKEIDRFVVTTGPGSFTGLRVGLAAMRGFGVALDKPVLGLSTLEAMSLSAPPQTPHKVLFDARRNQHYCQAFAAPGQPSGAPHLLENEEIEAHIKPGELVLGTGAEFAADRCAAKRDLDAPDWLDIARMARYGALLKPEHYAPEPLYVRAADAKPQSGKSIAREGLAQ
ncbi:tRNA (adenosine(37)-N6)-threonylcarbamoyltransferase complex dimerization subunit type 1 TsaB [Maritalea mediterranea]|uniref:tRNA (Adenosine(37)-N6)-threonylcarbamoyltransferase complex dimerization subunit type 1 TsaB n=1 Tax=Maritalea mediterranea TaxID=2909667 RepID=A0ABS9E2B2_9HYPH|nr:tRNA (adenosine(37)-N6)-threonylcarbamoyltransferase complex dimerization subunit type 1 TsaB [Maritalea mediterranea]MCF4096994.1 tRNA (adenosine(37)-N6)-threonylcarbamoyltransferase complex dimerization subunit type 1 TsaB [Maritalea mediterranea]